MVRWQLLLEEFDITYVTQKSIKGITIADHLAAQSIPNCETLITEFPDEHILVADQDDEGELWRMYFDGAMNPVGKGARAILISPDELESFLGVISQEVGGIWRFVADCQSNTESLEDQGRKASSIHEFLMKLVEKFDCITFHHIYRDNNQFSNALASLASLIPIPRDSTVKPIEVARREKPDYCYVVEIEAETPEGDPWYDDIKYYL
ncbi:uncharacterized protein LOC113358287 [Papaver somniferum]|uniref:uncharacterized protein LOC113358287 n=1 Tax=Papaver somniferum TaxID=3469 RepID=UPI000E6FFB79|nr:uncharacterized protein LOC113358287 [Papaver somniferum]